MSTSASRVANLRTQLALVLLIALPGRHLTRENPRRNRVHPDLAILERRRQHTAQMRKCRFRRRVRELPVGTALHGARDGRDVDDLRCVAGRDFAAFGEEREEGHAHEVVCHDVCAVGFHPLLVFGAQEVLADSFWVGHFGLAVGGYILSAHPSIPP